MSPGFPPSAIFLQSSFHSQQQAENFLNTTKYFHALKMATLAFKPYTYMPTALRSKKRISLSSIKLSMPQSAVADNYGSDDLEIRAGNGIITNHNENDNDFNLPSIEQLLYTTLPKKSFAAEDQPLNNATFKVGDRIPNKRGGSLDNNGLAPGSNPSGTPGKHALYPLSYKQTSSFANIA